MNADKSEYSFPRLLRLDQFSSDWGLWREVNMLDGECVAGVSLCVWECRSLNSVAEVFVFEWTRLNGRTRRNMNPQSKPIDYIQGYLLQQWSITWDSQTDGQDKQWYQDPLFSGCASLLPHVFSTSCTVLFFIPQSWIIVCKEVKKFRRYSHDCLFLWSPLKGTHKTNLSID